MTIAALLAVTALVPLWNSPDTRFIGFSNVGQVITQPIPPLSRYDPKHPAPKQSAPPFELRDLATGNVIGQVKVDGLTQDVYAMAITPDLKKVAWVSGNWGDKLCTLNIWTSAGRINQNSPGLCGSWKFAFSPDSDTLATANVFGYVQLWDTATGERRTTILPKGRPDSISFGPDGQTLAIGERFGVVGLCDVVSASEVRDLVGSQGTSVQLAFTPDGQRIVTTYFDSYYSKARGQPVIYDTASGQEVGRLPGVTEPCPTGIAYIQTKLCIRGAVATSLSADGTRALVTYTNQSAVLYSFPDGKALASYPKFSYIATLSPDGHSLLKLNDNGLTYYSNSVTLYHLP